MNWNFFTCLDAQGLGARLRTYECSIGGSSINQAFQIDADGHFLYRNSESREHHQRGGCVAPEAPVAGHAVFVEGGHEAAQVEVAAYVESNGAKIPSTFRLRSEKAKSYTSCAVAAQASNDAGGAGPGWTMSFQKCNANNSQEVLYAKPQHGGFQVSVSSRDSGFCLDSAGGSTVLMYPCYADKDMNMNQVWHIKDGRLSWNVPHQEPRTLAVDFQVAPILKSSEDNAVALHTCSGKEGQRIRKHDIQVDGSFSLRDEDSELCIGAAVLQRQSLRIGPCSSAHRFTEDARGHLFKIAALGECLDANDYQHPEVRRCHGSRTQHFQADEKAGWVKVVHGVEDNGRKRYYEKCLDSKPEHPVVLSIQPCDATAERGVRWKRINSREPLEATIWKKSPKPSPDAVMLGGDAEPPT